MTKLLLILALLLPVSAVAQDVVKPSLPFDVQWWTDGSPNQQFRALVDGVVVKNWTAAEVTKSATAETAGPFLGQFAYRATVPPLTFGLHTLVVQAYNAFGKEDTNALALSAGAPPNPPKGLKLYTLQIAVAADGTITAVLVEGGQ